VVEVGITRVEAAKVEWIRFPEGGGCPEFSTLTLEIRDDEGVRTKIDLRAWGDFNLKGMLLDALCSCEQRTAGVRK